MMMMMMMNTFFGNITIRMMFNTKIVRLFLLNLLSLSLSFFYFLSLDMCSFKTNRRLERLDFLRSGQTRAAVRQNFLASDSRLSQMGSFASYPC